ncbi:MAG: restriction endonuclease subunit S [Candidatus Delongbacteria bacterium]|jgi:type I restriction enzyme S subunit|nr:restriction endonuclease subunit S [Candidatus Delongbacteria bacterium]
MRNGWKEYSLKGLGFVGRGKSRHRPRNADFLYGNKYPFIQTADVKSANYRILNYSQMYSEEGLKQSKLWPIDTLCVTIAANIADSALLGFEACFPDSVIGFIADDNISDVRFVKYLFDILQVKIKQISQGAAQDNLSLEKLEGIKFEVPPLPTQRKIASILSAYDDLIENNLKRIKLLEEMAQKTYEEWFVKFRIDGKQLAIDKETGLPDGWEMVKMSDFGKVITGKTPSTIKPEYYGGNIPFIKTPSMSGFPYVLETAEYLTESGANSQKNKYLPKNTLVVSCIGTAGTYALVGRESQTNQQINAIKFKKDFYTFYLYGYSKNFKNLLDALGSNGATMTNVNKTKFENIKMIMPEEDILKSFHKKVSVNFEIIFKLQSQNQKLKEARDILLPRLMTGMIDVEKM